MNLRSTSLVAAIALGAASVPATAQSDEPPPLPELDEWQAAPAEVYVDDVYTAPLPAQPVLTTRYPDEARAAWLEQCRATRYNSQGERQGEVIGAGVGAVAGAIAGSQIADDEVAGALIGAGVGGLAGSAVGGEIGEARDEAHYRQAFDYCEDYLARYEQAFAAGPPQAGAYPYVSGPVMWVRVPIQTVALAPAPTVPQPVVEEWFEEEAAQVAEPAPRDKRVPIRRATPAPTKRVRVTK
jgi:uncharacterized protein YcfJ